MSSFMSSWPRAFLEFFWTSYELVLAGDPERGSSIRRTTVAQATAHTAHMQASTNKEHQKERDRFRPKLGPHQSEREITKDIQRDDLYLTSIRVSNMQTSVILLVCSV